MRTQGARNPKKLDGKSHQISEAEAVSPKEKGFVKHFLNKDTHLKAGSGTCNVCAAPCSSCLHFNRAVSVMESKAEGGSPKNSNGGKDADLVSFSTVDLRPAYKSRTFNDQVQAASETSNLFSAISSHDSFSENADSKATVRTSETHDTSEGVDMPLKVAACEAVEEQQLTLKQHNVSFQAPHRPTNTNLLQKTFVKHQKDSHGLECHGENILCVNGSRNENVAASDIQPNLGKKDMPYSSTSTTALLAQCLKLAGLAQVKDGVIEDRTDLETSEDDVEVCDICGDVGREDLLAICSRCNDGAEHIYCMRVKVDKVPKGDWLCEECQLKEDVGVNKVEKSETLLETSRTPSRANSKLLPKLDVSASNAEVSLGAKGLKSQEIFAKRLSKNVEITSPSNKRLSETHDASPSRKPVLSHEDSFKNMDAGKVKPVDYASQSGIEFSSGSRIVPCSHSPGPNLLRSEGQHQLPRGLLSKSSSFNSTRPKVKQIFENVPQMPQVTKGSSTNEKKMEGFVRSFSKSTSFKNTTTGHVGVTKSIVKTHSLNLHQLEESRNLRQGKERVTVERKNSFLLDHTLPSSSTPSSVVTSVPKLELKASQNDGKLSSSVPNTPNPGDAHGKVGQNELKECVLKTLANLPFNGSDNFADQSWPRVASATANIDIATVPQQISMHSSNHDEKTKDSSSFGSSQPVVSSPNRALHCQKRNELGHAAQSCTIDKVQAPASHSSAKHSTWKAANNEDKQKNIVVAPISRGRVQKALPDRSEEASTPYLISEVVPKNQSSGSSSHVQDFTVAEGTTGKHNSLRVTTSDTSKKSVNGVKKCVRQPTGSMWSCKDGESDVFSSYSEELRVKTPMQTTSKFDFVLFDPLGVSSLPDHEYMWQGSFDVKKAGRLPELFEGIQAHMSTHASPRVLEVVTKFPDKIQLEEVSRLSTWPLQFQENSPTEENIALFFFAKDVTSYEKSYSSLLENMMNHDLALTGNFNGVELLIFPSSKLPEKSQCWNQLFFLWGVFRERKANCLQPLSGSQSKSCLPNFNVEHMLHDLPTDLMSEVVLKREIPCEEINKVISRHDKSTNMVASDSSKFSSLGPNGRLCYMGGSAGQRNSNQGTTESNFLVGTNAACSVTPTDSISQSELSRSLGFFLESRTNNGNSLLCLEAKDNSGTCQKEFIASSDIGHVKFPVNIQITCTQINHQQASDRILPAYLITSDPEPPKFSVNLQDAQDVSSVCSVKHLQPFLCVRRSGAVINSKGEEKMKYTAKLMERGTASDSDTMLDKTEVIRQESEHLKRKRAHSYSPDPISQFFTETSTGSSARMLQKERVYISLDEEREEKKMKLHLEAPACGTSGVDTFLMKISSKVQPHLPGFLNEQPHSEKFHSGPTVPGNPGSSRRYNFSLDSGSVMDVKSGNLIPLEIVSSDDEDNQESHVPNLELGFGGDKKAVKREILSLFLPLMDDDNRNQEMSDSATQDGDDESSLSLSLAFPLSDKEYMK